MIAYNITTQVDKGIAAAWLAWQQQEHIPAILATGLFEAFRIYRLLDQEDLEGPTYVIQFFSSSREKLSQYVESHAPALRKEAADKWGDRFIAFRTVMEVVN